MLKFFTVSIGCGLALSLAACSPPAGETVKLEATKPVVSNPQTSNPQTSETTRENRPRQTRDGTRRAPPEIAYAACDNLEAEAACSFETPRGTRNGVCRTREGEDRAVCFGQRPEGQRRGEGGQRGDGQRPRGERLGGERQRGQ